MKRALLPLPANEEARLAALYEYSLLDTAAEEIFDTVTWLASQICNTPISVINLVDRHRVWIKSAVGFDQKEVPREQTVCTHTILQPELVEIENLTHDQRFHDNPFLINSHMRFYAGMPLANDDGLNLGVLCVVDYQEKKLNSEQRETLKRLAKVVMALFEAKKAIVKDSKKRDKTEKRLRVQSSSDPLTHLYNRRYLDTWLLHALDQAVQEKTQLSIIMLDVDHFKQFNDEFGHEIGDAVLKEVATLLQKHCRKMDVVCRFGGDEFILIFLNTSADIAYKRAEELRKAMHTLEIKAGSQTLNNITASLGVAVFPDHAETAEQLMLLADKALYQAKQAGRDKVIINN